MFLNRGASTFGPSSRGRNEIPHHVFIDGHVTAATDWYRQDSGATAVSSGQKAYK